MTVTTHNCEQRSAEWLALRCGIVTASTIGQLITPTLGVADNDKSRGLIASLVAERCNGWVEESSTTFDMLRGIECEPIARHIYSQNVAEVREVGFMVRREADWTLGFSPDGLVGDDGLIEIKSPRAKTHLQTIVAGEMPGRHMAQCQAGLLVSGRKWIDFVSFSAGMPLFVERIEPSKEWFDALTAACVEFEERAAVLAATYLTATDGLVTTERLPTDEIVVG